MELAMDNVVFTYQIQGVTLKCKTKKVYSGFYRRTNKHNANQIQKMRCPAAGVWYSLLLEP
jgi:hypothetical protein